MAHSPAGYAHPLYAESLAEFSTPRALPRCGGWLMERPIDGFPYRDAMNPYPLFSCTDWSQLEADLDELEGELVSVAVVTDPFGDYCEDDLRRCFRDTVIPFKHHFVVDMSRPLQETVTKRHRKHARRALKELQVDVHPNPIDFLDEWVALYDHLIARHDITGVRAFSRQAFATQLSIPGTEVIRVMHEGEVVGAQLCFIQDDVVHCHLGAFTPTGYKFGAAYALDWFSLEYFAGKARWYNLGGGVGVTNDGMDGLSQYKRGWATETRVAYFCGRILDKARYDEILRAKALPPTTYFPAYRQGEFS